MPLKQKKDGTFSVTSERELQEVASAIEEREAAIAEIESLMEESHDYLTMKEEIAALSEAMRDFMAENDVAHVFRDNYQVTLVRRSSVVWDTDKLRKLLPKGLWLKVTRYTVDSDKIDDAVRSGLIERDKIAPALTEKPQKPHIRRFPYKDGSDKDAAMDEERKLREQMQLDAAVAGRPTKRGKK